MDAFWNDPIPISLTVSYIIVSVFLVSDFFGDVKKCGSWNICAHSYDLIATAKLFNNKLIFIGLVLNINLITNLTGVYWMRVLGKR